MDVEGRGRWEGVFLFAIKRSNTRLQQIKDFFRLTHALVIVLPGNLPKKGLF
jgi:hypothetical protein